MTGRRVIASAVWALFGLLIAATGGWAGLALWFGEPHGLRPFALAGAVVALVAIVALCALRSARWRWWAVAVHALSFVLVLFWWRGLEPSNERNWKTEVAVLPYATVKGDQVTVHDIRNFDYRTETDFTPAYYDRRFDLSKLSGVDLIAVYWMGPAIAHTFLSFEFGGNEHLAVSIETRTTKGDAYSTLKGFFRQYELHYVVADERDVVRVRTNYRHDPDEETYIYRVTGSAEDARRVFMQYLDKINELKAHPQFYNTLTSNCTTDIWSNTLVNEGHLPLSWKILVSGYVPQYLYENGRLGTGVPFDDLVQRAHANERAHAADKSPDFSRRIRTWPGDTAGDSR